MCLILLANHCHPKYKLVIAANRDEYYIRPTLPACFWLDNPLILAGKDLQEGGTWMGITITGRIAGLTNYRDPLNYNSHSPSRGHLVKNYLASDMTPMSYIQKLVSERFKYNGFNILAGTIETLYYYSNREGIIRRIEPGYHGLSNSFLDVPWPKVTRGVKSLKELMQQNDFEEDALFQIMADTMQPDDYYLPNTGVSLEWERILAPIYVKSKDYGTRTTTVITVDYENVISFWERSFQSNQSNKWQEVSYQFKIK